MLNSLKNLHKGLAVNKAVKSGFLLVYLAIILFLIYEAFKLVGLLKSAAWGLFLYMFFPGLFTLGFLLLIVGWITYYKKRHAKPAQLIEQQFDDEFIRPKLFGSAFAKQSILVALLVLFLFGFMNLRMFHFMEESYFCGTACHDVMNPEWQTYQSSAHAHVECVDCHVGPGISGFLQAKLDGTRQLLMMLTNTYKKPIPAPVHQMRPAREVCEHCHWPSKFFGQRLVTHVKHGMDSLSTPTYTTLNVKVDVGLHNHIPGAHWHVGEENRVVYTSVDLKRLKMIKVRAKQDDGSYKEWINTTLHETDETEERVLDCIDCHNRATHIYRNPEKLVDELITAGKIDKNIPFAKQQSLAAITSSYPTQEEGIDGIAVALTGYYKSNHSEWLKNNKTALQDAISSLQHVYQTNIHQYMNIDWGAYPNHIGHERNLGCFRCHNSELVASDGSEIKHNCTMCHSILASDSDEPYQYLKHIEPGTPETAMHDYLQNEFFNTTY